MEDTLWSVASILCTGGADVIRKEAWSFYRTIFGVRLCWEFEEPKKSEGGTASERHRLGSQYRGTSLIRNSASLRP
jgi:hypothetical protein